MKAAIQPKRPGNPTWRKGGPSPNPGGRPAIVAELRELAREHTSEAIETLISVMRDKSAPPASRVTAAREVLDRGYGRPAMELALDASLNTQIDVEARPVDLVEAARQVSFLLALAKNNPPPILEADASAGEEA